MNSAMRWVVRAAGCLVPALVVLTLVGCGVGDGTAAPTQEAPPYLGQEPPGTTPVLFAPGTVSTDGYELNAVFSPDGRWFLFTRRIDEVYTMFVSEAAGGRWTEPRPLRLVAGQDKTEVDMAFSSDSQRLFFIGNALAAGFPEDSVNIWVSRLEGDTWGPAEILPRPINADGNELYPTIVGDGSLYFASNRDSGKGGYDSYRAQYRDGAFDEPVNLPHNSPSSEGDIYVSPDEHVLIVTSDREGGAGRSDLYIAFRDGGGSWGQLVHMDGAFSTDQADYCPQITPDGKYFFFSRNGDVYWVDASVLESFLAGG